MIKNLYFILDYSQIWLHLPRDDCHFGYKQKFLIKTFFGSFFVSLANFLIVATTKLETFFSVKSKKIAKFSLNKFQTLETEKLGKKKKKKKTFHLTIG
jgi:hypothetical protein